MSIIEIGWHFANDWSLLRCVRALDGLGYTRQERKRIVHGWVSAQQMLAPDKGQAAVNSSNSVGFALAGKASRWADPLQEAVMRKIMKSLGWKLVAWGSGMSEGEYFSRYCIMGRMPIHYEQWAAQQSVQRIGLLARLSKWFGAIANR